MTSVHLAADYDDGVVVFLNGQEIWRSPEIPAGPLTWNTLIQQHESSNGAVPDLPLMDLSTIAQPLVQTGTNRLAVALWNVGSTSSDLVVVPQLVLNKSLNLTRAPYLQQVRPEGITLRWRTDIPTDSRVRFGTSAGVLDQTELVTGSRTEHSVTQPTWKLGSAAFSLISHSGRAM